MWRSQTNRRGAGPGRVKASSWHFLLPELGHVELRLFLAIGSAQRFRWAFSADFHTDISRTLLARLPRCPFEAPPIWGSVSFREKGVVSTIPE